MESDSELMVSGLVSLKQILEVIWVQEREHCSDFRFSNLNIWIQESEIKFEISFLDLNLSSLFRNILWFLTELNFELKILNSSFLV